MAITKKTKASGTRFENRVKKWLEKRDWVVFRSAGSRSCADLIGFKPHYLFYLAGQCMGLAVQCKASEFPVLSQDERDGLASLRSIGERTLVVCRSKPGNKILIYCFSGKHLTKIEIPEWL